MLIAGPCVMEAETATLRHAERLMTTPTAYPSPSIFKASFDKANRTSLTVLPRARPHGRFKILARVREALGVPVLSDIHSIEQVEPAAQVLDVIQIPAFLCRQTDLLVAAAESGRVINIKKGQFMAPLGHGQCGR